MQRTFRIRYWLLWWTFIGFACRAVVPVGYMPASLAEGGPFVLCHGGSAGAVLHRLLVPESGQPEDGHAAAPADSHAHPLQPANGGEENQTAENRAAESEAWEFCPIGVAVGSGPVSADLSLHLLQLDPESPAAADDPAILSTQPPAYRSRAPPSTHIV